MTPHRLIRLLLVSLFFAVVLAAPAAHAADKVGVVLLHGKNTTSDRSSPISPLIASLKGSGFLVVAPDMPWSRYRGLDKDYEQAMAEIDAAVSGLKSEGATKIVVGGHSMGANAALGYGARRDGLAGIVAIAPGHVPDAPGFQQLIGEDYRQAREMVAAGKGDEVGRFRDVNQGRGFPIWVKAAVYLSWFDPEGPAAMPNNAAALKPGTALYWIIGENDPMLRRVDGQAYAFDKAPKHPKSAYVVIDSGHRDAPAIGAERIVAWLNTL